MMLSLSKIFNSFKPTGNKPVKLVILGSSGVGKTTLVRYLETEKPVDDIPLSTIGMDYRAKPIKIQNIEFSLIDVGGQTIYKEQFWKLGIDLADAVIYIFDGTIQPTNQFFSGIVKQFEYMLKLLENEIPLLILINKQDLPNCVSAEEYIKLVGLTKLKKRSIAVLPSSAKFGEGLDTAFLWLIEKLNNITR